MHIQKDGKDDHCLTRPPTQVALSFSVVQNFGFGEAAAKTCPQQSRGIYGIYIGEAHMAKLSRMDLFLLSQHIKWNKICRITGKNIQGRLVYYFYQFYQFYYFLGRRSEHAQVYCVILNNESDLDCGLLKQKFCRSLWGTWMGFRLICKWNIKCNG